MCIFDWMLEDDADTGIPHFVADNISWLYPVDPKKINCVMLLRENKSLASAIMDLGEQIQQMKQMPQDFCQNYVPTNNPQSEVEAKINELLTDARMSLIEAVLKHYNLLLPCPHNGSLVFLQKVPSTLIHHCPILLPHLLRLNPPIPLPHRPSILPNVCPPLGPFNPPPPLHYCPTLHPLRLPVLRGRTDKPQSASAVQNEEADFTVVDRKKKRKESRERHESKQQAQRGTRVNIDCRWAPPGITKLWVSLPKQGAAMITISRRITKIIN